MARTLTQVFADVRDILQDSKPNRNGEYRYPDAQLARHLNSAYTELKRIRPDAWLSYVGQPLPFLDSTTDPIDTSGELPVDDIFYVPIVNFMSGFAELRDDTFTVDSRAALLLQQFQNSLTMPIGATGGR